MTPLDTLIFVLYVAGALALGLMVRHRGQDREEFHAAGRSMRWFPVGVSIVATAFSAVNFTAFSGEVFQYGLYVLLAVPMFVLIALPITRVVMPFYHRLRPLSVYEFLEVRFDSRVRRLAAGLFVLWRLVWLAVVLYATCRLLAPLTGIGFHRLVFLAGAVTTAYTAAGGLRSVMWTDVAQFTLVLIALAAGVAAAAHDAHGFKPIFTAAADAGRLKPFLPFDSSILSLDPRLRITLWSALLGTFTAFLARYGADQMILQRYFSARSLRDAVRGFWLNAAASIVALLCLAVLGCATYAHAAATGAIGRPDMAATDHLAALLAALPAGICGLAASGLLASTMSSVDSGIHSCCTALTTDFAFLFPSRARPAAGRPDSLVPERIVTVAVGAAATVMACFVGRLGTLFEIANKVINGMGSPLLAVVLIGMFGRRGFTANGVLAGGLAGILGSAWISVRVGNLALHYYAVANLLVTLALCLACSAADRLRPQKRIS